MTTVVIDLIKFTWLEYIIIITDLNKSIFFQNTSQTTQIKNTQGKGHEGGLFSRFSLETWIRQNTS